jgi:hypothetical protein
MCVDVPGWQQRHEDLRRYIKATGTLPPELEHYEGQSLWLPALQLSPGGHMYWREEWWYPPVDLLARVIESAAIAPQGILDVRLETSGRQFYVLLPLVPRAVWIDPRQAWKRRVVPFLAQQRASSAALKKQMRQGHFAGAKQFQEQGVAFVCATAQTPVKEVLSQLVLAAQMRGFPTVPADTEQALDWIKSIVRSGLRYVRMDNETREQMVQDHIGEIYEALRLRFVWPVDLFGFKRFIQETARGFIKQERTRSTSQEPAEPSIDPATGEQRYSDTWVARDIDQDPRTVRNWKKKHGIVAKGLSETELAVIRLEYGPKKERKRLRRAGKAKGMSTANLNKLFQRKSLQAIEAHIKRHAKDETSADTLSIEEQIDVLKARCDGEESGNDTWCALQDAIKLLEKQQQGSAL